MDTIAMYAAAGILFIVSLAKDREKTKAAFMKGLKAIEGILPQFIAVLFIIAISLSLLSPSTIGRYIGESSGIAGSIGAAIIGAITLIPGFVAFPVAGELLRNGAGVLQIATFVSTLMMVGVITFPMEAAYFGKRAALARNMLAFVFSFAVAFVVSWAVSL